MVGVAARSGWLVAVGRERVMLVKMGDLMEQTTGNGVRQESEPP